MMASKHQLEGDTQADAPMACDTSIAGQRSKRTSWLPDCQQLCQTAVGCSDITTLQNLASKFLSVISVDVESCLSRKKGPRITSRLCSLLKSFLIHLHMKPSQLKAFTGPLYEDLVAALLSYYVDLSYEVSNANASVAFVSNIVTMCNLTLGHSPRHIIETLLQLKKEPAEKWNELYPLLKRILSNTAHVMNSPSDFIKTVVLMKQWMTFGSAKHQRRICKLGSRLVPPSGLAEWLSSHGFHQLSDGLQDPGSSASEFLLSDRLTAKCCNRLLDVVCNATATSVSEPTVPSVAHAPKGSGLSPCFFVLDRQPDKQVLTENDIPTGDDNCKQLYRALDNTIEAMDMETSWRFGLGDGDMDDDIDLVPLQFHLENSIEQNGFDVTPPKAQPLANFPEEGKVDVVAESNEEDTVIANVPSKTSPSPCIIKSSDRNRRKSSVSSNSGSVGRNHPEIVTRKSSPSKSRSPSNQKSALSSMHKDTNRESPTSGVNSADQRIQRRDSRTLSAAENILAGVEDVARNLFPRKRSECRRRTSSVGHSSQQTGSTSVLELVANIDESDRKGSRKRTKHDECETVDRKSKRKKSNENLFNGKAVRSCKSSAKKIKQAEDVSPVRTSDHAKSNSSSTYSSPPSSRGSLIHRKRRGCPLPTNSSLPDNDTQVTPSGRLARAQLKKEFSCKPNQSSNSPSKQKMKQTEGVSRLHTSEHSKLNLSVSNSSPPSTRSSLIRSKRRGNALSALSATSSSLDNDRPLQVTPSPVGHTQPKKEFSSKLNQNSSFPNKRKGEIPARKRTSGQTKLACGLVLQRVGRRRTETSFPSRDQSKTPPELSKTTKTPSGEMDRCKWTDGYELKSPGHWTEASPDHSFDVRLDDAGDMQTDASQMIPESVSVVRCLVCKHFLPVSASPLVCRHCGTNVRCQVRLSPVKYTKSGEENALMTEVSRQCVMCNSYLSPCNPDYVFGVCDKCWKRATSCFVLLERLPLTPDVVLFDCLESNTKKSVNSNNLFSVSSASSRSSTVFLDNESCNSGELKNGFTEMHQDKICSSDLRETLILKIINKCSKAQGCAMTPVLKNSFAEREITIFTGSDDPPSLVEVLQLVKEVLEGRHADPQATANKANNTPPAYVELGEKLPEIVTSQLHSSSVVKNYPIVNDSSVLVGEASLISTTGDDVEQPLDNLTKGQEELVSRGQISHETLKPHSTEAVDSSGFRSSSRVTSSKIRLKQCIVVVSEAERQRVDQAILRSGSNKVADGQEVTIHKVTTGHSSQFGVNGRHRCNQPTASDSDSTASYIGPMKRKPKVIVVSDDDDEDDFEVVMPSDDDSVNFRWDQPRRHLQMLELQPSPRSTPVRQRRHSAQGSCSTHTASPVIPYKVSLTAQKEIGSRISPKDRNNSRLSRDVSLKFAHSKSSAKKVLTFVGDEATTDLFRKPAVVLHRLK